MTQLVRTNIAGSSHRLSGWTAPIGASLCVHVLLLGALVGWRDQPRQVTWVSLIQLNNPSVTVQVNGVPEPVMPEPSPQPAREQLRDLPVAVSKPVPLKSPVRPVGAVQRKPLVAAVKQTVAPATVAVADERDKAVVPVRIAPARDVPAPVPVSTATESIISMVASPVVPVGKNISPIPDGTPGARVEPASLPTIPGNDEIAVMPTPESAEQRYLREQYTFIRTRVMERLIYPALARRQGWTGKVGTEFTICADGRIEGLRIVTSSGRSMLDKQALRAIQNAAPFPSPPAPAVISLPVVFSLEMSRR